MDQEEAKHARELPEILRKKINLLADTAKLISTELPVENYISAIETLKKNIDDAQKISKRGPECRESCLLEQLRTSEEPFILFHRRQPNGLHYLWDADGLVPIEDLTDNRVAVTTCGIDLNLKCTLHTGKIDVEAKLEGRDVVKIKPSRGEFSADFVAECEEHVNFLGYDCYDWDDLVNWFSDFPVNDLDGDWEDAWWTGSITVPYLIIYPEAG